LSYLLFLTEAQYTPVYAIAAGDFDHDGICDIVLGGNQYRSKPEAGINDAGYGLFLKGEPGFKWKPLSQGESGLFVRGQIRDMETMMVKDKNILVIALNNNKLSFYEY
jgi:enediyne biosynthesis protein E4